MKKSGNKINGTAHSVGFQSKCWKYFWKFENHRIDPQKIHFGSSIVFKKKTYHGQKNESFYNGKLH